MSFCYKKILGVFTHLRVTTPNIIEPKEDSGRTLSSFFCRNWFLFKGARYSFRDRKEEKTNES